MVLESFLLSTNTHVALFYLTVKQAMVQSAVMHSDDEAQPAE